MDNPWLASSYDSILATGFLLIAIMTVAIVCIILVGCLIKEPDTWEDVSSSLNVLSRSRNKAIRTTKDHVDE